MCMRMLNKLIVVFFIIIISNSAIAKNEVSVEKKVLIDEILQLTGRSSVDQSKQLTPVFVDGLFKVLVQSKPSLRADPEKLIKAKEIIVEEVNVMVDKMLSNPSFLNGIYSLYATNFSEQELKDVIAFHRSETGQKITKLTPLLAQEGLKLGQVFAKDALPEMQKRLKERLAAEGIN